jgi:GNAT superfamily N-acetyltransferase
MKPPTIRLEPMTPDQLQAFIEEDSPRYAAENVRAGFWPESGSLERAREAYERFLPQGIDTPGHHLFVIRDELTGVGVGTIWIGAHPSGVEHVGMVLSLYVEANYRRQGYARQAMLGVENLARQLGWVSLGLQVFGDNQPAGRLYNSLGYKMRSMNMVKALGE